MVCQESCGLCEEQKVGRGEAKGRKGEVGKGERFTNCEDSSVVEGHGSYTDIIWFIWFVEGAVLGSVGSYNLLQLVSVRPKLQSPAMYPPAHVRSGCHGPLDILG